MVSFPSIDMVHGTRINNFIWSEAFSININTEKVLSFRERLTKSITVTRNVKLNSNTFKFTTLTLDNASFNITNDLTIKGDVCLAN